MRLFSPVQILPCTISIVLCICSNAQSQTIWSGHTFTFQKPPFADETLLENQDRITGNVWLTRAATQGIFNVAQEDFYTDFSSPAGTEWAFPNNNPGAVLTATNWASLLFEDWKTANGGTGGGPPATVGQDAVLHLIAEDIYLDISFLSWGSGFGSGGEFSYARAEPPPVPNGDYNANGVVDAADYVYWRKTLDQTVAPAGTGADGDASGTIDEGDYTVWFTKFGSGGGQAGAAPKPSTIVPVMIAWAALLTRRNGRQQVAAR